MTSDGVNIRADLDVCHHGIDFFPLSVSSTIEDRNFVFLDDDDIPLSSLLHGSHLCMPYIPAMRGT